MVRIVRDPGSGIRLIGKEHVGSYYLMHHGVKGQKHGVRQWQNKDGSYTPEGYQHYKEMYGWGDKRKASTDTSDNVKNLDWVSKVEKQRNKTNSDGKFERDAYAAIADKKIKKAVIRAIDQTPNGKPTEEARDLFDSLRSYQQAYDEYSSRWNKDNQNNNWTGDGSEFHTELARQYPEYKKLSDKLDHSISRFVKKVLDYSKSPQFDEIKGIDKYANFFDKIVDPNTHRPWYQVGDVKAFIIASILSEAVDEAYVFPQMFLESFDSRGKRLQSQYLAE